MIRPAYWTDADLHTRLNAAQREFYIGLWMEADDAGFVAYDVDRLGADLYPYRSLSWRRLQLPKWVVALDPHVEVLECGLHLLIPSLHRHQAPPKPSYQHQRAHQRCIASQVAPAGASGGQRAPAQGLYRGGVGRGMVMGLDRGASADADGSENTTEFRRKLAAAGGKG